MNKPFEWRDSCCKICDSQDEARKFFDNSLNVMFTATQAVLNRKLSEGYELVSGPKRHIIIAEVICSDMEWSIHAGSFYVEVTSIYMISWVRPVNQYHKKTATPKAECFNLK